MGKWKDYYSVLGIDRDADEKTIKKAYRKLAKKYHPDISGDENTRSLFQEINEAYETLGNEEKKATYDAEWDARKNGTYASSEAEPEVDYEDVKHQYSAEERRYAKREALKQIIEEELEKVSILLDAKNEIILSVYSGNVDKRDYYRRVKELVSVGYEYINSLLELGKEAYKYDLLEKEELINQTVDFLDNELKNIPLSPRDAMAHIEEESLKEALKKKAESEIERKDTIIEKLRSLFIYCYTREVTHLEYGEILESILLEAQDSLSVLRELAVLAEKAGEEETLATIQAALAHLRSKLNVTPKDYESTIKIGKKEYIKETIKNILAVQNNYEQKIRRIAKLLDKYPYSHRYPGLYQYCLDLYEEMIKELKDIIDEAKNIRSKELIIEEEQENLASEAVSMFKKADSLYKFAQEKVSQDDSIDPNTMSTADIILLTDVIQAIWNEKGALELLVKAREIKDSLGQNFEDDEEYKRLYSLISQRLLELPMEKEKFEVEYNLQRRNPYHGNTAETFEFELEKIDKEISVNKKAVIIDLILTIGFLIYPIKQFIDDSPSNGFQSFTSVFLVIMSFLGMHFAVDLIEETESLEKQSSKLRQAYEEYSAKKKSI